MKTLTRWIVALVVMSGGAAYAQNIAATWQGARRPGRTCGS